ncbi:MAG: GlsB/YeaQ/YmgE family stress response membrane protein [Solirubrobacteraceae bacterium]|nr:GlsB/YeaQ/YmgE family stress response membrane protein [Solirubrobacteraceae bacterium]
MGIVAWFVLGLVAGVIGRMIVPGPHRLGCLGTAAVGVLGALIGGAIASAAEVGELGSFYDSGTWGMAILGSILLLLVLRAVSGRARR